MLKNILTQYSNEYHIYAILDGVKHKSLWEKLEKTSLKYAILFEEDSIQKKLKKIAPYLIKLDFQTKTTEKHSNEVLAMYEEDEILFFNSYLKMDKQVKHTRAFFHVYSDNGELHSYFRFYDSIVFTSYIEAQSLNSLEDIFKDVYCFWCKEDHTHIMQYFLQEQKLKIKSYSLKKEVS